MDLAVESFDDIDRYERARIKKFEKNVQDVHIREQTLTVIPDLGWQEIEVPPILKFCLAKKEGLHPAYISRLKTAMNKAAEDDELAYFEKEVNIVHTYESLPTEDEKRAFVQNLNPVDPADDVDELGEQDIQLVRE